MIEISPVTLTHSVTDRAMRNLPFSSPRPRSFLGGCDLLCGPSSLQIKDTSARLNRLATALDPVRRNGHQHLGRLKQRFPSRRTCVSRHHKDDSVSYR